jgi:hypothetical protein
LKFLVETPTFFANSLRFAGKSDALAELCGRCALHTAEETGEIRPSIIRLVKFLSVVLKEPPSSRLPLSGSILPAVTVTPSLVKEPIKLKSLWVTVTVIPT